MGKLTKIQAYAYHIISGITKTDSAMVLWIGNNEHYDIYNMARGIGDTVGPDCINIAERCASMQERMRNNAHIIMTRSLLEEIQRVEGACERIARDCGIFHDCVERLSQSSSLASREVKSTVETGSQKEIAWGSEKMLRLARKLAQRAREEGPSRVLDEENAGVDDSVASSSGESINSMDS